jgi:lipid-binding SYLF domain-containing protein
MTSLYLSRRSFIATSLGGGIIVAGCTTTGPESSSSSPQAAQASNTSKRAEIDAAVDGAIADLNRQEPGSRQMIAQSKGMLVFPKVFKAGLVVGGEYGEGALRIANRTVDYYSASAGSIGLQAGAQEKSVFLLFMTDAALAQFRQSSGWTAGADASVALVNVGASGAATTQTAQRPVVGYVLTQGGLMVDASVNGTKVSKLNI